MSAESRILAVRARWTTPDSMDDEALALALLHGARISKESTNPGNWRASARDALTVSLAIEDIGLAWHARELLADGSVEGLERRVRRLEEALDRVMRRLA